MSQNIAALSETIQLQLQGMQQMLTLLREEYDAVSHKDYMRLVEVVEKKQSCTEKLIQNDVKLSAIFKSMGFEGGFQPSDATLTKLGEVYTLTDNLVTYWQKLMSLAKDCREQNQINGRVINTAKIRTKQLLDILQGWDGASGLYNDDGKTDDNNDNQSIAIA